MNYVAGFLLILYGIGIVFIFKTGLKKQISPKTHFVLINAKNTKSIEYTIRTAMKKYPMYDIYVMNGYQNGEMCEILKCFERDFPRIHVIKDTTPKK